MARKGHYGAGSIDKSGSDSWRIRYRVAGKRHAKTFRGTKTEAHKELRRLLASADDGTHVAPNRLTFSKWADQWLALKEEKLKARTYENYEGIVRLHLKPVLGGRPLQKITATEIDALYQDLGKTLAKSSMGLVHVILKSCLKTATRKDLLSINPADRAERPATGDGDEIDGDNDIGVTLDDDELGTLVRGFKETSLYGIVALASYTGMRRNEILALRTVEDIDLDAKTIKIRRNVEQTKRYGRRIVKPKTKRSIRTIAIDDGLVELLRSERERQLRLVAGIPDGARVDLSLVKLPKDALLFPALPGADLTTIRSPGSVTLMFCQHAVKLGYPDALRFHDLRGSHETCLLDRGVPVHTVASRCGHSPAMLLKVYAKRTKKSDTTAANVIGTLTKGVL